MKHTMVRSNQEEKKNEFKILIKQFKKKCPWVKVRPPREPCDRQPSKTNRVKKTQRNISNILRKRRKVLDKTLNKRFWKSKAKANIVNMSLQLHQNIESNQYTNWTLFREHLQRLFNNKNMNIGVTMI